MSNDYFDFRKFSIKHDRAAMKVGTDGVLLGAWIHTGDSRHILDVGTGTGLIAIMLAQKSAALIDAVEIDSDAVLQAIENVRMCPWKERIEVINDSFQNFSVLCSKKYDLVISNPPYFKDSLRPPDNKRSHARHNDMLDFRELILNTAGILSPDGRLAVIIPFESLDGFIAEAHFSGLYPQRICRVRPVIAKPPSRALAEFGMRVGLMPVLSEITIRDGSGYTDEYKNLTKDFYLFPHKSGDLREQCIY